MNRLVIRVAAAGVALLGAVALATAADPATRPSPEPAAGYTSSVAGMRVYVDPESGALVDRPVTQEQKDAATADAALFRQDDSGLTLVTHPDGSKSVDLEGRYELATQIHKSANGAVSYSCNDAAHLEQGTHAHAQLAPAATGRDVR